MGLSEVLLSYDSASGKEEGIRTFSHEGKLYFSLYDVVRAIQHENRVLDPDKNSKSIVTLIKAHITHLLPKEIFIRNDLPDNLDKPFQESYVTKAGLLRVVLQDNSPACIKFQEWVLEDVLPTVLETGKYEHPSLQSTTVPSNENFDVEAMLRLQLQETIERKKAVAEVKEEINNLGSKVKTIEKVMNCEQMIFVADHELVTGLPDNKKYEVFSHCIRLCAREPHIYKSRQITKTDTIDSKIFSRKAVDEAITYIS